MLLIEDYFAIMIEIPDKNCIKLSLCVYFTSTILEFKLHLHVGTGGHGGSEQASSSS